MLWGVTGLTQQDEISITHDHGWKDSRDGSYNYIGRVSPPGTPVVSRGDSCIQYLNILGII